MRRLLSLTALAAALAFGPQAAVSQESPPANEGYVDVLVPEEPSFANLFSKIIRPDQYLFVTPRVAPEAMVESARTLRFNTAGLTRALRDGAAPPRLQLTTPRGEVLRFEVTGQTRDDDSGIVSWTGASADIPGATAVFSMRENRLRGSVNSNGRVFLIAPTGRAAEHQLVELNAATASADEGDADYIVPPTTAPPMAAEADDSVCDFANSPSLPQSVQLRVMVLFTTKAARSLDVQLEAKNLIDEARAAWTTSHFRIDASVAYAGVVDYAEQTNGADLKALQTRDDGVLDEVHALRDRHQADVVVMLTTTGSGLGYLLEDPEGAEAWAFSVAHIAMAQANKTLIHEIGHNLGMQHDRYAERGGSSAKFNYGYVAAGARQRDIMAYEDYCRANGYLCPRALSYSTPHLRVGTGPAAEPLGRPLGQPDAAYNVEALCRNARVVSRYR